MRVALVGSGIAGLSHALDIVTSPELEFTAVCSRTRSRAAELAGRFGVPRVFRSVTELLDAECCDAVVVAVPPAATLPIVLACRERSLRIMAEKPVARSASELPLVEEVSRGVLAPFNRRYLAHVREAVEAVHGGAIGAIRQVDARWVGPYLERYAPGAPTYRARAGRRQGLLVDTGSHVLDALSWVMGPVRPLPGCRMEFNARGAEVGFDLLMRNGDGATASVRAEGKGGEERWEIRVTGDRGQATLGPDTAEVRAGTRRTRLAARPVRRPVDDLLIGWRGEQVWGPSPAELVRLSETLVGVYDLVDADARTRWLRPRFKPWGRLNGSC
ncbi:Gfo/Idh/MocA family protein [Nonomuraea turcica]|uniref:Gfo/Idh/MocA family protein n=1 Tax=Nonomuraea sp. G32 TaxID=3067274 RepID=UPI00273B5AB0|nr:Gfo/Idh/MocA family oxidoreductase [Nonomuraea sp. G32]MDP4500511.1 Gfo/Idh/MocA family oxidoreductase [Nonomuraea sp. G32]